MLLIDNDIDYIKEELQLIADKFTEKIFANISRIETIEQALKVAQLIIDPSEPIDPKYRIILNNIFDTCYKDANPNLTFNNLSINWSVLANHLSFPSNPFNDNEGVGLFYLIDNSNPANLLPTFVISRAERVVIGGETKIIPINTSGSFLMLKSGDDNGTFISSEEFDAFMTAYKDTIKFQKPSSPLNLLAKNYNHPYVTFHEGIKFTKFFNDNFPVGSTVPSSLKILVEHGASFLKLITTSGGVGLETCLHTSIIFFKNGDLLLDDQNYPNLPFKNKGLDVGRLCPPDC